MTLEELVLAALRTPVGSLEDAIRAWEPAAELACLLLDDEAHRGNPVGHLVGYAHH